MSACGRAAIVALDAVLNWPGLAALGSGSWRSLHASGLLGADTDWAFGPCCRAPCAGADQAAATTSCFGDVELRRGAQSRAKPRRDLFRAGAGARRAVDTFAI